jgi:CRP/FNR family transcriptional activator FtrB
MSADLKSALLRIGVFSGLPEKVLDKLAAVAGLQRLGRGSTLFREGEEPSFVYGLVEGTVALESGPEGGETIADFMEAGDIVLVPPALLHLPYMVTVRAVTDLTVVMLPVSAFRQLAGSELSLSAALNRMLASHWRLLLRHLTHTISHDADSRLAQYLRTLAGRNAGPARFTLPDSKKALASHLGFTPSTLSRSLKRLSRLGVRSHGGTIEIEDVARLHAAPGAAEMPP